MKLVSRLINKILKLYLLLIVIMVIAFTGVSIPTAMANSAVNEVKVSLGNENGELKFFPSNIQLEARKPYKLLLDNPSPVKHYFTAKDFADASWTKKVEASKVEVKGAIHELELKPGAIAEWFLTPMKSGTYELHCSIKGHAPAGMVGKIIVE